MTAPPSITRLSKRLSRLSAIRPAPLLHLPLGGGAGGAERWDFGATARWSSKVEQSLCRPCPLPGDSESQRDRRGTGAEPFFRNSASFVISIEAPNNEEEK